MLEKSITPSYRGRHPRVLRHPCVRRTRDASEGALLLLTRGRALAYATPHSPWTPVERACTSDAPYSQGKGMCGAMLDVSGGGRAGTVVVARQAEGPAGTSSVVQACLPWMAVPRNEQRDETAGCGLRGLETGRDGAGPSKLGRDGQWRPRAVLSGARQRRAVQEALQRDTCRVARGSLALLKTWTNGHAPAARKHRPLTLR